MDLQKLFFDMQQEMIAKINVNKNHKNPGAKGTSFESTWIKWFRKYLPDRYSIDSAFIIDHMGNTSQQMDIVIYDTWYTPFIFKQNKVRYIPAEGVYAVFEVKPDIKGNVGNKSYIAYAGEKIESVRVLKRGAASYINSGKKQEPRPLTKIIGGILCNSNGFSHKNNASIISNLKKLDNFKSIDLGCIADYGSFYIDYYPKEEITEAGVEPYYKFYRNRELLSIHFSKPDHSLVTFFIQLTRYLQQAIGTIPAINLNNYLAAIGEKLDDQL